MWMHRQFKKGFLKRKVFKHFYDAGSENSDLIKKEQHITIQKMIALYQEKGGGRDPTNKYR